MSMCAIHSFTVILRTTAAPARASRWSLTASPYFRGSSRFVWFGRSRPAYFARIFRTRKYQSDQWIRFCAIDFIPTAMPRGQWSPNYQRLFGRHCQLNAEPPPGTRDETESLTRQVKQFTRLVLAY